MNRLKEARKAKKMTQQQAAAAVHVSQGTYSSWETGRTEMQTNDLMALSKLYGVTPSFLMGVDDTSTVREEKPAEKSADSLDVSGLTAEERKLVQAYIAGLLASRHTP